MTGYALASPPKCPISTIRITCVSSKRRSPRRTKTGEGSGAAMSSAGDLHRRRMTTSELVFDPFSEDFFNGPYELYRRMREEAPVYYNEEYDFYALSRHEDVAVAFKDFGTYSSAYGLDLAMLKSDEPPSVKMIIIMDPPEHRHMRSLVNKVFTPRAIENMRPM